jgi:hypothetical protein
MSIDRLRSKIDAYVERFETIRASQQLCDVSPNDDYFAETKVLDILRPLIFVHWTKMLHQIPDPAWKEVCTTIAAIDNHKRRKMAARATVAEEMDHALEMMFNTTTAYPVFNAEAEDADETADLLLFAESDDDDHSRRLCNENRSSMHAWINEQDD